MELGTKTLAVLHIGGIDFWITETIRNTWIIMGALIVFAIVVRVALKRFEEIPKGFQNVVELMVEFFDNFVHTSAGEKLAYLGNWFFMVFAFILLSNISGLFFLRPPTADWTVTISFALVTFVLIQAMGIKYRKGGYFKSFLEPIFLFLPLNIIGELARPISLSFRLFGNVLGGMILISLLYNLAPIPVRFVLPVALHGFFDIFAGVLQTYIFSILSLSFIGVMSATDVD
jgi:F-type H+-transporting ATPase subunit a